MGFPITFDVQVHVAQSSGKIITAFVEDHILDKVAALQTTAYFAYRGSFTWIAF
jgi:hypothetical protein